MKLSVKTIPDFLRAPAKSARAVLLYGPDAGLVQERLSQLLTTLLGKEHTEGRREILPEHLSEDPALLADELGATSLFAEARAVVVRLAGDKNTKVIEAALEACPQGNYLLVTAGELGARSSLRALFEGHKALAALPCYRDEAQDVRGLLSQRLAEQGIRAAPEAMDYLSRQLGADRLITLSEIDKIGLYAAASKTLSLEEAQALVPSGKDAELDALCLAVADGNMVALETQMAAAQQEALPPVMLLRSVQRHYLKLLGFATSMEQGKSAEAVVESARPPVFFRQVPVITRQLKAWPRKRILSALTILKTAEAEIKTSSPVPALVAHRALLRVAKTR